MLRSFALALAVSAATLTTVASASSCPTYIQYANGSYLKNGDYFFHANGSYLKNGSYILYANGIYLRNGNYLLYRDGKYLKNGSYLLYPNGIYLRNGSYWFYEGGQYLKNGSYILYPNGKYLRNGSNLFYANGNYLQNGSYFLYSNGTYARNGSKLYRADGTPTSFPVTLKETIGTVGSLEVVVSSASSHVDLQFPTLLKSEQADAQLIWSNPGDGEQLSTRWTLKDTDTTFDATEEADGKFRITTQLSTGRPNETVTLNVAADGTTECILDGGDQPRDFTLDAQAARVEVHVKPGYDPVTVRAALLQALNSL